MKLREAQKLRKTSPEGSVVLSKEEYSDYLKLKNDYAHAKEKAEKLQADNERLYKNVGKFKDQVRKETAEKLLKEVADCMRSFEDDDDGYILKQCEFKFFMREIATCEGVEVEE